jgi:hypothetical protein
MSAVSSDVYGRMIGMYEVDCPLDEFKAIRAKLPNHFRTSKKLLWDSTQGKVRHVFHTNRGNFFGPIIRRMEPNELAVESAGVRLHRTYQVKFHTDFDILSVTAVDLENQIVVPILGGTFPILIRESEPISFEFNVEYFLKGKRP